MSSGITWSFTRDLVYLTLLRAAHPLNIIMKIRYFLLPILVACYPILSLLAENSDWITPTDTVRSLLISVLTVTVVFLLSRLLFRDWAKASLITALVILIIFSYGHIYTFLRTLPNGVSIGRHRYLVPIGMAIFGLIGFLVYRHQGTLDTIHKYLTISAGILIVFPLYTLVTDTVVSEPSSITQETLNVELSVPEGEPPPDIYYIVLDAYAREDVLETIFEYDNSSFLEALQDRGFYVVPQARSNHAQTSLSLASSLNMDFIQVLFPEADPGSSNREPLWNLIHHSRVRGSLEEIGYETVTFSTGFPGSDIQDSDHYYPPEGVSPFRATNEFESLLIDTTAAKILTDASSLLPTFLPDLKYPYKNHQARILTTLDVLPEITAIEAPTFTFAHILTPHAPFVFGPEGELLIPDQPYNLKFSIDGDDDEELTQYITGYQDQVTHINARILPIIDTILEESDPPPIIVLQADHGPAAKSGKMSYVTERMRILNAIYLPSEANELYPDLSPVNTFRVIFNTVFNADLEQLPDRSYYSEYQTPYDFKDVTLSVAP